MRMLILQQAQQQASPILLVILGVRRAGAVVGYKGELQSPDLLKDVLLGPAAARNRSDSHMLQRHTQPDTKRPCITVSVQTGHGLLTTPLSNHLNT